MSQLRIQFYAEGRRRGSGSVCNLFEVCGKTYDSFVIEDKRWYSCRSAREQEDLLLGVAKSRYPEVEWTRAFYNEIKQV